MLDHHPGPPTAHEAMVEIDGRRIWTCGFGLDAPGTPVLVVHGGPGLRSITDTISELADERPVHFYDQLGCGRSDRADDPAEYTLERYERELLAVIDRLGLADVILLGHSWGGGLAAATVLDHAPGAVRGLILSAPLLSTPVWLEDARRLISRMPDAARDAIQAGEASGEYGGDYAEAARLYYRRHLCRTDPWPPALIEAGKAANRDVYTRLWGPSEFTANGSLRDFDLSDRLPGIDVPTLLLCGDQDEITLPTAERLRAAIPGAALAVIPDASHFHQLEQPAVCLAVLRAFLARL